MIDKEKVLKQLAGIGIALDMDGYHADAQCVRDAINLLREQEPVKPKWFDFEDAFTEYKIKIPICGACESLIGDAVYCPQCGRKVKWDD